MLAKEEEKMEKLLTKVGTRRKRKRVTHSLELKLEVLKRIERGERQKDISVALGLSKSTVNTIYISREQIKARAKNVVGGISLTKITRGRHEIYDKLEKLLVHWIDSHGEQAVSLSTLTIQEKARSLFVDLKKKAIEEGDGTVGEIEFKGSHGWFERFKKRAMLHNLDLSGELASADSDSASTFPEEFLKIVEEGNYTGKQIFNMAETALFWKRMPTRSFVSKVEAKQKDHIVLRDRFALLLGGNLEGDIKLKPLLVYHTENPRALKGIMKNTLPVVWRSNRKAWVTREVFINYIKTYFGPFVKEYCAQNNLANKVILVLGNAPGHPVEDENYGDNVHVVFLPPSATSLLQPMDQGIISTFKAYYLQQLMKFIVGQSVPEEKLNAMDIWKDFNIKQSIDVIAAAWSMISQQILNSAWKHLCPTYVNNFKGFEDNLRGIWREIVNLAAEAGFNEVDDENVSDVLASHNEVLSNGELLHLDEEQVRDEKAAEEKEVWDVKMLRQLFDHRDAIQKLIDKYEPNAERGFKAKMMLQQSLEAYRSLYEEKKKRAKQLSILDFFKPINKLDYVEENSPSTSGYKPSSKRAAPHEEEMDLGDVGNPNSSTLVGNVPLTPSSPRSPISHSSYSGLHLPQTSLHTLLQKGKP